MSVLTALRKKWARKRNLRTLCGPSVYECTRLPPQQKYYYFTRHSGVSLTRKPAARKRNTVKKYRRSDPIGYLDVMKVARSVFAYKEQSVSAALCYMYRAKHMYEINAVEISQSHGFVNVVGWIWLYFHKDFKKSMSSKLHSTTNYAVIFELPQAQ